MSYQSTAHCDVCNEPRRQTNHWFQIRLTHRQIAVQPFTEGARGVLHLCGETCLARMVTRHAASLFKPEAVTEQDQSLLFAAGLPQSKAVDEMLARAAEATQ